MTKYKGKGGGEREREKRREVRWSRKKMRKVRGVPPGRRAHRGVRV